MRHIIKMTTILLITGSLFLSMGCEQLGLGSDKKDDNTGLLLLLGLAASQGSSSSGFFVTIPNGVAK